MDNKVSELNRRAEIEMSDGDGFNLLDVLLVLSALVSGIFFWTNSGGVFAVTPFAIANNAMAVAFGVTGSEGAFFGWRRYRKDKRNMTSQQLNISTIGAMVSILTSGLTTLAAIMLNNTFVPETLAQYRDGIVLLAIAFPLVAQTGLAMLFALFSQDTVENFKRAQNEVLVFNQKMELETARIMSLVDTTNDYFEKGIDEYRQKIAPKLAETLFNEGAGAVLNFGMGLKTEDAPQALRKADRDGDGVITQDEWHAFVERYPEQARRFIAQMAQMQRNAARQNGVARHNANLT